MDTIKTREETLRAILQLDRGATVREYRNAMHLHGDPAASENVAGEEMIKAILKAEEADTAAC